MAKFKFYRVGESWAMKLDDQNDKTGNMSITLFKDSITDDEITTAALILAKGDNIYVDVDYTTDKGV